MHHHLDKLAGVRLRSDVDEEIASENRAVARIEENIGAPIFLKTCAYCSAIAVDECSACDTSLCEDDATWQGVLAFCPECLGIRP